MILVVDDDIDSRDVLCEVLEASGQVTVRATDGREAFDLLGRMPAPDLILLDMDMPVMDGRDFLVAFERLAHLAEVPVIIISGSSEVRAPQGRISVIAKPVSAKDLRQAVEQLLSSVA